MSPLMRPIRVAAGLIGLLAAACGDTTTPPVVASVDVGSPVDSVLDIGQDAQFTALARQADGTPVAGIGFTWRSTGPSIAEVSGAGLVTAVGAGRTEITASVGQVTGRLPIRVVAADIAGVDRTLNDPLVAYLLTGISGALRTSIAGSLDSGRAAAAAGNIVAADRHFTAALAAGASSSEPDDVALTATLDLLVSHAQRLLGF